MNEKFFLQFIFILFLAISTPFLPNCSEPSLFWWHPAEATNFGDELSRVIVERITRRAVRYNNLKSTERALLAVGSILHVAREGDIIWGSGLKEPITDGDSLHTLSGRDLDIRAVRGPRTRRLLHKMGIDCPRIYGDPALLLPHLFPEFKKGEPLYDYIIIPNIGEMEPFSSYKNVVLPTEPWRQILHKILRSRLVISGSLHAIIVAEAFGIPARLLKMTWVESLLKYQDYYESTGRKRFRYATSVQEALRMGGERPGNIDTEPLLNAFPWDLFSSP